MRNKGPSRLPLLLSLLTLSILTVLWWGVRRWYGSHLLAEQRRLVTAELTSYGKALGGAITQRLALLRGLSAFVESHASAATLGEEFKIFAAGLFTHSKGIRNFVVAPGGVLRYVYPLGGNESLLGHNLIQDPRPNVRADVKRAIRSRKITLTGPYQLRRGGLGLVARLAVSKEGSFWGLVAMVLDVPPILEVVGLYDYAGNSSLAVRDGSGQILFGDGAVFNGGPVLYQVELPEGAWDLGAVPRRGWNASIRRPLVVFDSVFLTIALLLTCLTYLLVNRQARLNRLVERRTEEVTRANEQLGTELAERKRVEEELRRARDELEDRVRRRTAAIEKANEALAAEIEERRRTEQERNLLLTITRAVTEAEDFHSALGIALRKICEATSWDFGEGWVPTPDGAALELSPAWYGRGGDLERFRHRTTRIRPKSGAGLIVRVWRSRQPEWNPDVSVNPLSYRGEAARQAGLKAGLAVPVIADDQVQAILVFFMSVSREEDRGLVEVVSAVAAQLGSLLQRKRAEQALLESERRFHAIFNQTYEFVGLLRPDGVLLEANETALEFVGSNLSDVMGCPFWDTPWWDVSPEVRNRLKDAIAEAAKGNFVRYETEHRRGDGSVATFDFSLKPVFDENGRVVLIIPEGRDITGRKRAEEALRRARDELEVRVRERTRELAKTNEALRAEIAERQRLQEQLIESSRLAAIGTTAAKIAHEIANPLNGMSLTAQRLERQLARPGSPLDEAVELTLRRLKDEISRLHHLLDDFRSLSQREKYNFQPTALPVIAGEIFALEAENYARRGISVAQVFPADLPLVRVDRDKLKQALWNLCKNAVEAMPQGGTLTLHAYRRGPEVVLEIRDTGVGIPPGVDIFEPFTTTKTFGTGLGLVMVRQVVAAHRGTITYTSEPGRGTTFRLALPQVAAERPLP